MLHESQQAQLKSSLAEAQQELDELDDDRDKAAFELKQAHGKVMAAMEKLRYFEAVKQERQQYADEINVLKDHKSELEAELREQEARHDQENLANSEKSRQLNPNHVKGFVALSSILITIYFFIDVYA